MCSSDLPTDDIVSQSASTTFTITDTTSVNYGKAITMSIQYYAARTSYEWVQLSDPAGVPAHYVVRNPITYTGPYGNPNIFHVRFTGQVDADGNPATQIPLGDATAVWNTFAGTSEISSFQSKEIVPGHVWQCSSVCDFLLIGT